MKRREVVSIPIFGSKQKPHYASRVGGAGLQCRTLRLSDVNARVTGVT